jgi:hypothetical protein
MFLFLLLLISIVVESLMTDNGICSCEYVSAKLWIGF